MNFFILTSSRWCQVAEAHRNHLASKWGANVVLMCVGDERERDEEAESMFERWSKLRLDANLATRFNDPARVLRWLATAKEDVISGAPYVVFGSQGDSEALLVGGIQEISALGALPFGSLTCFEASETALVVRPGPELDELCRAMVGSLLSKGVADRIEIQGVRLDHPAYGALSDWGRLGARGSIESKIRWGARLLDPETGERVDMHSGKTRANLRKADRKLAKAFDGDAELESITRSEQVDDFVRAATSIIQETYQAALGIGVQDTEAYHALLREMADAGALRGYLMRCGGEPIAYVVGDRWGTTFSLWGTSFRPEHRKLAPGIVTIRRVMDSLAAEGVAHFDFGCGHAEYKKKLGDHHCDEADLILYAKRPVPSLSFAAGLGFKTLEAGAQRAVDRLGLRDRLRTAWRKRLAKS